MNNTAKLKALDALYATLPKLDCQRLCTGCCSTIGMSRLELRRIEQQAGPLQTKRLPVEAETGQPVGVHYVSRCAVCPLLKGKDCSVYNIRPAICRLWGLSERMKCPHGCQPERVLSEAEVLEFMRAVQRIGF